MNRRALFVALLAVTPLVSMHAETIVAAELQVPQDYATVQLAVNAASPGDVILIDTGTYAGAVITKEVHVVGAGPDTVITEILQLYGALGPKAAFFLPGPGANNTSISHMSFKPFAPEDYPNDGVSFPVFCRTVNGVKVSHISSDSCVQGVTFTKSTNSEVGHCTFNGVTTWFASGGGIGVVMTGEGSKHKVDHNSVSLDELFDPEGFSPVGISVIALPSNAGVYAGSSHDVLIRHNSVEVLTPAEEGTQGVEVSTHAGYLPAQGPAHTDVVVAFNNLRVGDPELSVVSRLIDDVTAVKNLDGSKGGRTGADGAPLGVINRASGRTGTYN